MAVHSFSPDASALGSARRTAQHNLRAQGISAWIGQFEVPGQLQRNVIILVISFHQAHDNSLWLPVAFLREVNQHGSATLSEERNLDAEGSVFQGRFP